MKLKNAARFFDRDSVYDAYTGLLLFKAQFSSYDGAKPDGTFERRRTVSTAPGIVNAPRRVVKVDNDRWILGEFISDSFFDAPIRQTASAKLVTDTYVALTPGQAALRNPTGSFTFYAQTSYLKDTANAPTNSDYTPFYEVHFGSTEPLKEGYFLRSGERLIHLRTSYPELEGYKTAAGDELASPSFGGNGEVNVTLLGAINPITEQAAVGTSTTGILLEMYMLYDYRTQADPKNLSGDKTLILSNTVSPITGSTLTINGATWRIQSITPYYDAWNLHIRRA